jgi:hypothetical protein
VGDFCAFIAGENISAAKITSDAMRFINSLHLSQGLAVHFRFLKT